MPVRDEPDTVTCPDTLAAHDAYGLSNPPTGTAAEKLAVEPFTSPESVPRPVTPVAVSVSDSEPVRDRPVWETCHDMRPGPDESLAVPVHAPDRSAAGSDGCVGVEPLPPQPAVASTRLTVTTRRANREWRVLIAGETKANSSMAASDTLCGQAPMKPCDCTDFHPRRRVVLTGGPGAGKTAVLELIRLFFCEHVMTLPESAGIVFGGRFPRNHRVDILQAAQRAIFHVQRELESTAENDNAAVVLCDRGTIDCSAYWAGDGDLFSSVGTTREAELERYDAVIHLRTPTWARAYNYNNPLRIESLAEAAAIDARIMQQWSGHPRRFVVEASEDFLSKASHAMALLRNEVPPCCRHHVRTFLWDGEVKAVPAGSADAGGESGAPTK